MTGRAPLSGIAVLDFTKFLPGPYCTWLLAELGATVTRVEHPRELAKQRQVFGWTPEQAAAWRARDSFARNKRSIALDPGEEESRLLILQLADRADVLVEDYRPGVMAKMGLGYDALSARNPRLIYGSVSLCGQTGPLSDKPGHDPIALAVAGVLGRIGEDPGAPQFPGIPLADMLAGSNAVVGIMAALLSRAHDGLGQHVDIAMSDSAMALVAPGLARAAGGPLPPRGTRRADTGLWRCADGRFLVTTDMEPRYWQLFCVTLGFPQFAALQHDVSARPAIAGALATLFATRPAADWLAVLEQAGTQVALVQDPEEAFAHPHNIARGMAGQVPGPDGVPVWQLGCPVHLSGSPPRERPLAGPADGDRQAILAELSA